MEITNIDFSGYDENDIASLQALADQISTALKSTGFMSVSNIGIDSALRDKVFKLSKDFFMSPEPEKRKVGYITAQENFGYQGIGEERLDPSKPADIKETFTMRNLHNYVDKPERWPSDEFRELALEFFQACTEAAKRLMYVFSVALDTDREFFVKAHKGENITLRFLHYPPISSDQVNKDQLGAGAHTDYGMITLLFQDEIEGLEVQDKDGNWLPAPAHKDRILINSGDMMNRWTNKNFRSTPHRVKPIINGSDRFSIAMFVDPDSEVLIETLESCFSGEQPNLYPDPITAGEHILEKIRATHIEGMFE